MLDFIADTTDIEEITRTHELFRDIGLAWWKWGLIVAGVIITLNVIIHIARKPKKVKPVVIDHLSNATRTLDALLEDDDQTQGEFAANVSMVLRKYINNMTNDESVYKTTKEIQESPSALKGITSPSKSLCVDFLLSLEPHLYQPNRSTTPAQKKQIIDNCKQTLSAIKPE